MRTLPPGEERSLFFACMSWCCGSGAICGASPVDQNERVQLGQLFVETLSMQWHAGCFLARLFMGHDAVLIQQQV